MLLVLSLRPSLVACRTALGLPPLALCAHTSREHVDLFVVGISAPYTRTIASAISVQHVCNLSGQRAPSKCSFLSERMWTARVPRKESMTMRVRKCVRDLRYHVSPFTEIRTFILTLASSQNNCFDVNLPSHSNHPTSTRGRCCFTLPVRTSSLAHDTTVVSARRCCRQRSPGVE